MLFAHLTTDGPPVRIEKPRREPLTRQQASSRRYALWLQAVESGFGPDSQPWTVAEVAAVFRVDTDTIYLGLEHARRIREQLAEVARG